jgi:hypothetical protein
VLSVQGTPRADGTLQTVIATEPLPNSVSLVHFVAHDSELSSVYEAKQFTCLFVAKDQTSFKVSTFLAKNVAFRPPTT